MRIPKMLLDDIRYLKMSLRLAQSDNNHGRENRAK